ncbi:MAG: beta-ketoacyl synthase, partial [uncultured bacterium]
SNKETSLLIQLLSNLKMNKKFPEESAFVFASSKGEIDKFEMYLEQNRKLPEEFGITDTMNKVKNIWGFQNDGVSISAACASSTMALIYACELISENKIDSAVVLTGDIISPFIFSGFASLMALDSNPAKPFDANRKGLSLGEGGAYILLMQESRAKKDNYNILGRVLGFGSSDDANHATGPSRDGYGLKLAIEGAFKNANLNSSGIKAICAHGTGTVYNDSMELKAFKSVFKSPVPVYSIKGGTGHMLGASGLVEIIFALHSSKNMFIPPNVNVTSVDSEALGWVSIEGREIEKGPVLSTNSGFGGINTAVIIENN